MKQGRRRMRRKWILLAIVVVATSLNLAAEQLDQDWNKVKAVPHGRTLLVELVNGNQHRGKLAFVSDSNLELVEKGASSGFRREEISRVFRLGRGSVAKPLLIGTASGAVAGAVLAHGLASDIEKGPATVAAATLMLMGTTAGLVVWAVRPGRKLLYDAHAPPGLHRSAGQNGGPAL
jgi:hypothetical protein